MLKNRPVLLVVNIFFCLAFLGFAYLNLNDPDPWMWVTLYLVPAFFCGALVYNRVYPKLYLLFITIFTIMAGYYFFTPDGVWDWLVKYHQANIVGQMHADKPYIEQTREFLGLAIVIAVLTGDYLAVRKS